MRAGYRIHQRDCVLISIQTIPQLTLRERRMVRCIAVRFLTMNSIWKLIKTMKDQFIVSDFRTDGPTCFYLAAQIGRLTCSTYNRSLLYFPCVLLMKIFPSMMFAGAQITRQYVFVDSSEFGQMIYDFYLLGICLRNG